MSAGLRSLTVLDVLFKYACGRLGRYAFHPFAVAPRGTSKFLALMFVALIVWSRYAWKVATLEQRL